MKERESMKKVVVEEQPTGTNASEHGNNTK